jgi:ribosomal protein S18 acetylase RimI-like enzyme
MTTRIAAADRVSLGLAVKKFMGAAPDHGYLESPATLAFVAFTGTEVSGWCWGYRLGRPDGSSMLYLHQLEVSEEHRRRGIGRQLLRAFMTAGAKAGATKMFLTTAAHNTAARSLYAALGGGLASQGPTVNYWFLLDQ